VNLTLRTLHGSMKTHMSNLQQTVNGTVSTQEEGMLIDKTIGLFTNEMIAHTSKVYMLSVALCERDPSQESAFELVQQAL
jgi:hypothetical protein